MNAVPEAVAVRPAVPAARLAWLVQVGHAVDRLLELLVAALLAADVGVVFLGVIFRYFFNNPLAWTEEIARLLLVCLSFVGTAIGFRRGQHIAITAVVQRLPAPAQRVIQVTKQYAILIFSAAVGWYSLELVQRRLNEPSPSVGFSQSLFIVPLSAGLFLMAIFAALNLLTLPRRRVVITGVVTAGVLLAAWLSREVWLPLARELDPLVPILFVYLLAFATNVPIGFDIGLAAFAYLLIEGQAPLNIMAQRMEQGVDVFVLLAVPFFILAGAVMETGGISVRLVELVRALIGHVRGGLGMVMIVSMYLFSGISGSKSADIAAVGSILVPAMRKRGHDPGEAVAILAASAAMGETVPPSLAILILGSISSLSVGALFAAGVIPALVIAVCLMTMVYWRARSWPVPPEPRVPWRHLLRALGGAWLALLMPVIIFGGILLGVATPTEVSAFAVVYALLVGAIVYREVPPGRLYAMLVNSACTTGVILFIISTATVLAWILTIEGIPQAVAAWMIAISEGPYLFLALTLLVLLVLGALLEGLPALIILAPLLLPVVPRLHINPLHYGIVLIIAMGIGSFSPPIGVGLFIASAVGRTTIEQVVRPYLPYVLVLLVGLIIVTFVPWFTLVLPEAFGIGG